jgi:MFS transporter, UMF1 family
MQKKWLNKQVMGWAMFDFANQAFTLVILTTMFQVYFVEYVVPDDESLGRRLWALSGIITQIAIIAVAPVLGALADFSGSKKKLLFITYVGCVIFTAALGLIPPGAVAFGMTIFIIAYLFYAAGENFMAAFLPELAPHRLMGRVSAFGWTMGYIGGLLCLAGAVAITTLRPGAAGFQLVSLWAGLFFLVGALPTFLWLREQKKPERMPEGQTYVTIGFFRLAETFRALRSYRCLFRFIAILTIYLAGLQTVYWFAGSLMRSLGFGQLQMGLFVLQLTVTAIVGAVITGRFQDAIGARNFIVGCLVLWSFTIVMIGFVQQEWMFWVVGNFIGLGIGALGTASRSMVGLFSPPHKAAEFFGFYGFAHKLSAIVALSWIGLGETLFPHNFPAIVASSAVFFVAGLFLMLRVDERAGRIAALRSEKAFQRRQARV